LKVGSFQQAVDFNSSRLTSAGRTALHRLAQYLFDARFVHLTRT